MTKKEKREKLAKSDFCRSFLYVQGFLSDSENEKVHQRIRKWQDKSKEVVYWIYGYYHGVDKVEEDEEGTTLM